MKKVFGILFALVLVLTLSLVMAVPAGAQGTVVLAGDVAVASGALGTTDEYHIGSGCWEVAPAAGIPEGKMQLYMSPTTFPFSSLGSFTIDDIESISYWTNKPVTTYDFYLAIYTEPDNVDDTTGWYGYRLNAEPYYSNSLSEPVNVWNKWNTDAGTNQLTFFDSAKIGGLYGFYGQPDLQDLQAGTINWHDYNDAYDNQDIDYGAETVKYISFQTGSGTNDLLLGGCIDEIIITLNTGSSPSLTIDLEKDIVSSTLGAELEEITAISVTPSIIDFGTIVPGGVVTGPDISVKNIGTVEISVGAELNPLAGTVFNYLRLGGAYPTSGKWDTVLSSLLPSITKSKTTALDVPVTYSAKGTETATLIFIATAK